MLGSSFLGRHHLHDDCNVIIELKGEEGIEGEDEQKKMNEKQQEINDMTCG
jgi:hypothetical protein